MKKLSVVGGVIVIGAVAWFGTNYYAKQQIVTFLNQSNNSNNKFKLEWSDINAQLLGSSTVKDLKIIYKENNKVFIQAQDFDIDANSTSIEKAVLNNVTVNIDALVKPDQKTSQVALKIDQINGHANGKNLDDIALQYNKVSIIETQNNTVVGIINNINSTYQQTGLDQYSLTSTLNGIDISNKLDSLLSTAPANIDKAAIKTYIDTNLQAAKFEVRSEYSKKEDKDVSRLSIDIPKSFSATIDFGMANIVQAEGLLSAFAEKHNLKNKEFEALTQSKKIDNLLLNRMNNLGGFSQNEYESNASNVQDEQALMSALLAAYKVSNFNVSIKDQGFYQFVVDHDLAQIAPGKTGEDVKQIYLQNLQKTALSINFVCGIYLQGTGFDCSPLLKFIEQKSPSVALNIVPAQALPISQIMQLVEQLNQPQDIKNLIDTLGIKLSN